jgi:creatinine amidohydrolase
MTREHIAIGDMTWPDVKALIATTPVVVLPVGAVEQHGPHMPLLTDTLMVEWLAAEAAARVEGCFVAPTIPYGMSANHLGFAGTLSLEVETLKAVLVDVGQSVLRHGFAALVILNGHGGNNAGAEVAAIELRRRTGKTVANIYTAGLVKTAYGEMESEIVWHADEAETSSVLAVMPSRVKMDRAVREIPAPRPLFEFTEDALSSSTVNLGIPDTDLISRSGTIGDATLATPEKGRRIVAEQVANLTEILKVLCDTARDEKVAELGLEPVSSADGGDGNAVAVGEGAT